MEDALTELDLHLVDLTFVPTVHNSVHMMTVMIVSHSKRY
jgi:hypothetical protein